MTATCAVCELHAESTFKVEGMDCREEVDLLERRFKHLAGLEGFTADLMSQRIHVKYDAAKISTSSIVAAVADAGMRAWLEHEVPLVSEERRLFSRGVLLTIAGAAFAAGLGASAWGAPILVARGLFALSLGAGLPLNVPRAWRSLRAGSFDIHVLMLVAVAGAITLGEWSEAAAVVFLFALAQALEARTLDRARAAVRALIDLTPQDALVRDAGGERRMPVEDILPGARIVIRPGEKVPLDGEVVAGASEVNQAPVTGESLPVDKGPGDEVFAGSINGRGALELRVTRHRRDTTLARIIHMVEQAQAQRAPVQTFVDRFARVYTPAVIVLAVVLALAPPLLGGAPWETWIYRSLVLLVVSCPCALVISTPVSIVAALAGAARKGVLIKGGAHLERAAAVRAIAFDKTGTLTSGHPEVADIVSFGDAGTREILSLAAAVEQRSDHPVARAIMRHAAAEGMTSAPALDVVALSGLGAEGRVDGRRVTVGNHRLFEDRGFCAPDFHPRIDAISACGRTPVLVARDGHAVGVVAIADRPRARARESLSRLREHGVGPLVMLTGDSQATAAAIAAEVGVDEYRAELMPEDKVSAVADLRARYGAVAMVGDGVNDAPALAAADVGFVMGAAGSDAALETADVALMADDLMKIPYAIRLSRATVRNIRANLAISLVMKGAFVVAAALGAATLWMAILADTGASIIVIANALRLLRAD
jgi:Cd2+/Zn2+-exporting ATPase